MATQTLEQRVSALEAELREVKARLTGDKVQPWWRGISGIFKDDPHFDEAMRLGREYRVSLRDQSESEG